MDYYSYIDYNLLESVIPPNKSTQLINALRYIGVINVLDIELFKKITGREPCVSSVFVVSCGSYSYNSKQYGEISIHNGTIQHIGGIEFRDIIDAGTKYIEKMNKMRNAQRIPNKAMIHLVNISALNTSELEKQYNGITHKLVRGDIIENISESGYRSQGITFWDGTKICEQDYNVSVHGAPPKRFKLVSEFACGYWDKPYLPCINWTTDESLKSKFYWYTEHVFCAIDAELLNIYPADNHNAAINGDIPIEIDDIARFNASQKDNGYVAVTWDGITLRDYDW